jgi:hypothetical protein
VQKLSEDAEEILLVISSSGFDWVAQIARKELLADDGEQDSAEHEMPARSTAAQLDIIQSVLGRYR